MTWVYINPQACRCVQTSFMIITQWKVNSHQDWEYSHIQVWKKRTPDVQISWLGENCENVWWVKIGSSALLLAQWPPYADLVIWIVVELTHFPDLWLLRAAEAELAKSALFSIQSLKELLTDGNAKWFAIIANYYWEISILLAVFCLSVICMANWDRHGWPCGWWCQNRTLLSLAKLFPLDSHLFVFLSTESLKQGPFSSDDTI